MSQQPAVTLTREQALAQAIQHHQAGQLQDAERIYRAILQADPNHPDANHNLGVLALQVNRPDAALPHFKAALEVNPDQTQYWLSYIETLIRSGLHDTASQALEQATRRGLAGNALDTLSKRLADDAAAQAAKPDPEQIDQLAELFSQKRCAELEALARHMTERFPGFGDGWKALGVAIELQGRFADALPPMQQAATLLPRDAEAHFHLGNLLRDTQRHAESISAYEQALRINPDLAEAHRNLGDVLAGANRIDEAVKSYRRAIELAEKSGIPDVDLVSSRLSIELALGRAVPLWHAPMMNDAPRNAAYLAALQSAITPTTRVLEIGTGSGLLSMMAARCGPQEVVTCEAVPMIAATASEIIASNGLSSSIRVIPRKSFDISVGTDLSQRANLLISELLDSDLVAEGVVPIVEDAKQRLLEPGARVIPAAGSIMFALFSSDEIKKNIMVEQICGFDMDKFNSILPQRLVLFRQDLKIDLLSDDIEAFCFDFANSSHFPAESKVMRVPIKTPGACHGIIQWIRLKLDDANTYENHPCRATAATSWGAVVYRLPTSIHVYPGQTALIRAAHNRQNSYLSFEGIEGK